MSLQSLQGRTRGYCNSAWTVKARVNVWFSLQTFVGMWDYYYRYLYSVIYLGRALSESQGLYGHSSIVTHTISTTEYRCNVTCLASLPLNWPANIANAHSRSLFLLPSG